jgi:hypothetical protein
MPESIVLDGWSPPEGQDTDHAERVSRSEHARVVIVGLGRYDVDEQS